ncbi:hypothetical protein [Paraburkholderia sp. SOS3]|uniref:hypothetical protein n=1 Tax=Paraburkholderia sp. SOS3 TaxID=1926494 RepID=UPI0012EB99C2|nr:hypothetical protein [Paraburkholderia sp. SOS3]
MNSSGLIKHAAYAFKRGDRDFWPAIAIFSVDEDGKEEQLFYGEPGYGKGFRGPGFETEEEALAAAREISAPHFSNGVLMVAYRGQIYPVARL